MRRSDREITDINEIFSMLDGCHTVSIGINTGDYPYVIPMTFGCTMEDGRICVYFHCAGEGRKLDLMGADPRVCVEGHTYYKVETVGENHITARYESVMGWGKAIRVDDHAEKVRAFKIMLDHYNSSGFPASSCKGLKAAVIYRIELEEVTGKRNK